MRALHAPSVGVDGTNRSSACVAWPPTTNVDVGSSGLTENNDRRVESGEGLSLGSDSCQQFTSSSTGISSVFTSFPQVSSMPTLLDFNRKTSGLINIWVQRQVEFVTIIVAVVHPI